MDEKQLEQLYKAVSQRFNIGDYNSFKSKMATSDDRKRFYDAVGSKGFDLGDYNMYESRLAGVKKKDGSGASTTSVKTYTPKSATSINDLEGSDAPSYFKEQQQAYNKAQVPEVDDDPVGNVVRKSAVRKQEIKQQHANSDATYVAGNYQNISKEVDQLNKEERAANNYRFETTADAKGVLQKFAPNIDELPDDQLAALDVKDNLTAQRAKEQVLDSRNIGKILSSNLTFESAAVQFGALKNPLIAKQIEAQGGNLFASKSQKGALVADLLTQPAVKEWAGASQENMNAYRAAQNNFMTNYPDLAASQLATILSKEREKRELNNGLLNSVSNEEMDAIVSDMVAKGDLTQQQRVVYEKLLRPQTKGLRNPYQTPGLFENLPKATKESLKGMARSVEEGIDYITPGDLVDEAVATQQDLEEDYTTVDFKPKGLWHEFSSATATLTPQVLLMGTGIKGLQAVNLIKNPAVSGALMEGMQSYGYNVSEARKQFPNEPVKQMAHATLTTAFEMAMSRVFPDEKVVEGIGKAFRGKTAGVIADFAEGKITSAAAKDLIQSDVQRILTETIPQFVGKTLKNTQKEALEEVVPQVLSDVLTDVFEGKPIEERQLWANAFDTWKQTTLGSGVISGLAANADTPPLMRSMIYDMAANADAIREGVTDKDVLGNLDFASGVVKDLDKTELTQRQKEKYLLHSLNEKVLKEKLKATSDSVLQQPIKEQIKASKEAREKLLITRQEQIAAKEEKQVNENKETETEIPQTESVPTESVQVEQQQEATPVVEQVQSNEEAPPALTEQELSQMQPVEEISEPQTIQNERKEEGQKGLLTEDQNGAAEIVAPIPSFKDLEAKLASGQKLTEDEMNAYINYSINGGGESTAVKFKNTEDLPIFRGATSEDHKQGFYTFDEEGAKGYAGKDGKVIKGKVKKEAKVLRLLNGDTDDYTPNKKNVKEFEKIIGKEAFENTNNPNDKSDITEVLWGNEEAVNKLKAAGIDVVIGNTVDGPSVFVVNESAVEYGGQEGLLKPYTTKNGKYTISIENGQRVIKDKDGNAPSEKTARTYLNEHAESLNYNQGATVEQKGVTPPQFSNQEEGGKWIVENSDNPSEIADLYLKTEKQPTAISGKEQAILTGIDSGIGVKVTEDSYRRFGDANNKNNAKARYYFDNTKGRSMDEIAREISDHTGVEVTPQDIADFIDRFPSGDYQARRLSDTEVHTAAKQRFEQLTGVPLTDKIATLAANQLYSPEAIAEAEQVVDNMIETEPLDESAIEQWLLEEANNDFTDQENIDNLDDYEQDLNNPSAEDSGQSEAQSNTGQNTATQQGAGTSEYPSENGTETTTGEEVKKTITTKRAYEGAFREGVKKELEKLGLTREVESQADAKQRAKDFIAAVGEETALDAVRNNDVPDAAGAYIWNELIEAVDRQILSETNPEKISELEAKQAGLINELSRKALSGGRFTSALGDIYANSDLGYKLEVKIQQYKDQNGGVIPADVEAKFRKLDEQLKEVQKQLVEAEQRAKEAEEKAVIAAIKEAEARKKSLESKKSYSQKAKETADKVRKLKNKPLTFKDADGNDIPVQLQGITWNDLVEAAAKIIEKTGQIADGIAHIVSELQKAEWYQKLDDRNRQAVMQQVEDYFKQEAEDNSTTDGKVKVKHSLIREAVEQGNNDINSVVAYIKEKIKGEYPDATDRDIRDAVTGYGKVVNPNKEDIEVQIRKIKRIGRIVSGLEDIANKKRPLRSGQQRDKLDAEERLRMKELREAMKELPMDADTENRQLKTAVDAAKQRLKNQIDDLQRQIETGEKIERSKRALPEDDEMKALREERDKKKEEFEQIFGTNELSDEQKLQNAIRSVERSIEEYERRIREKDTAPKKKATAPDSDELKNLKAKRDSLKDDYKKMLEDEGEIQKRRLESAKKRAQSRIEDLQRRIKEGDFSKKETKPVEADKELLKLKAEKLRIQEEYDKEFYKNQLANRTFTEKAKDFAWDLWGITRALRATGEMSFMGVQGLVQTVAHPVTAFKAFKRAISFMASEGKADRWIREIKSQEWYPVAKEAKLGLTEPHAEIAAREELFFSDWTNIIWKVLVSPFRLLGKNAYARAVQFNIPKALERGAVGYLDTLRVERFLDGMQMLKEQGKNIRDNKQDFKNMADVINTFTGRASLGPLEQQATMLSKIFFSPRNWASVIKTATPYAFIHFGKMHSKGDKWYKPSVAQKMALADFSKWLGFTTGMVAMAAAYYNNDDDDETSVEFDPRSSDFMKVKLGQTRVDPWGGRIQQIVLLTRVITDEVKNTKGKIIPLGTPYKTPTRFSTLVRMVTNKLSPSASMIHKYLDTTKKEKNGVMTRKDAFGNEYNFAEEVKGNLYPIYIDTVKELLEDDPTAMDGLLIFASFFGLGVNVYDGDEKKKKEKGSSEVVWK